MAVYDAADTLVMRFEYSDGRMPNVMTKGSATYYLTYDQVGSLRAVHDATGAIVKRIDYDSFGNIIADTNPTFTVPFGFAGGLDDRDIGLVHFGFRDYDPATGRWTAKDPIGFAGGDVDVYGYVLNDPINWIDPWGLLSWDTDRAFRSGVAGGIGGAAGGFILGEFGGPLAPFTAFGGAVIGGVLGFTGNFFIGGIVFDESETSTGKKATICALGGGLSGAVGGSGGAAGGAIGGAAGSLVMDAFSSKIGPGNAAAFGGAIGVITGALSGGGIGFLSEGVPGAIKGAISGGVSGGLTGGFYYYFVDN